MLNNVAGVVCISAVRRGAYTVKWHFRWKYKDEGIINGNKRSLSSNKLAGDRVI